MPNTMLLLEILSTIYYIGEFCFCVKTA